MTAFDYAATAATVTRLLKRFGRSTNVKRQTVGEYDPATGEAPVTESTLPTYAALFAYDQKYIDGTLIKQGDQRAYMSSMAEPVQGDKLAWVGGDLEIIAVRQLAPSGLAVLYEAQVRG